MHGLIISLLSIDNKKVTDSSKGELKAQYKVHLTPCWKDAFKTMGGVTHRCYHKYPRFSFNKIKRLLTEKLGN